MKTNSIQREEVSLRNVPKVNSQWTFSPQLDVEGEVNSGELLTVPDMVIPYDLMLNRQGGQAQMPQFQGQYSAYDFPDYFKMDKVEILMERDRIANIRQDMEARFHAASVALEQAAQQAQEPDSPKE